MGLATALVTCVRSTCLNDVTCNVKNLYETSNTDHTLTGPVEVSTTSKSETCIVLATLNMLARLKDEWVIHRI